MGQGEWAEIFSPWVMRSALRKVENYYAGGEWYDAAEWLDWRYRPWENLSELASEFIKQTYKPGPFPLIPYPKKGSSTRHYAVASVKDQVAFMVFMVLLGPFTEAQMTNTSMGHRLYRRRHLGRPNDEEGNKVPEQRWQSAPFSLQDRPVYEPFSRGYGLYRRLAQWIAMRGVYGAAVKDAVFNGSPDEDKDRLPYYGILTGKQWKKPADLYYARLDFSLAYPSVKRENLAKQLVDLIRNDQQCDKVEGTANIRPCSCLSCRVDRLVEKDRPLVGTHPWRMLCCNESLRIQLAEYLGKLLLEITYAPWHEPEGWDQGDLTNPMNYLHLGETITTPGARYALHSVMSRFDGHGLWPIDCSLEKEALTSQKFGLPTGLAVSGWLLNIALTDLDHAMRAQYELGQKEPDVVYLRFVDDMILMSRSASALKGAMECMKPDEFKRHPLGKKHPSLGLNVRKAEPKSIKRYLLGAQWDYRADEKIDRGNVSQFVTSVVREMSAKAEEAIDETGGALAVERLDELLTFATEPNADAEVAADAKMSFALNRIARNAWPTDGVVSSGRHIVFDAYLQQILQVAEESLRRHPHRFGLWRAALVIGMRAHLYKTGSGKNSRTDTDGAKPADWFGSSILPLIRWPTNEENETELEGKSPSAYDVYALIDSLDLWETLGINAESLSKIVHMMDKDPNNVEGAKAARLRRRQHERMRKSFLRACFWREWAWLAHLLQNALANGNTSRSPWLRHVRGEDLHRAWDWLKDFPKWIDILYPEEAHNERYVWWWETEAVRLAMLAVSPATAELIEQLGSPVAGMLRRPALPVDLQAYMSCGTNTFRVLFRSLGYVGQDSKDEQSKAAITAAETNTSLLWVKYCQRHDLKGHSDNSGRLYAPILSQPQSNLYPDRSSGALDWAALARVGLWNEWPHLAKCFAPTLDPPQHAVLDKLPPLWRGIMYLDTYAAIRRLLLAHGEFVEWKMFRSWFDDYGWTQPMARGSNSVSSAMYQIGASAETMECAEIPPAMVPAVGIPHPVAWRFVCALAESRSTQGHTWARPLTPQTALFESNDQYAQLVTARRLLFASAYGPKPHPTDEAAQVYDRLIRSSLAMRHRGMLPSDLAPHPVFLLPAVCVFHHANENTHGRRLTLSWQLASLYFWLASGDENVLYQLYDHAPWQLALDDRDDLRAQFLVPKEQWDLLDKWLTGHDQNEQPQPAVKEAWRLVDIAFEDELEWVTKAWTDPLTAGGDNVPGIETLGLRFSNELRVRLIQVTHGPKQKDIMEAVLEGRLHQLYSKNRAHLVEIATHLGDVRQRSRVLRNNPTPTKPWHEIVEDHLVVLPEFSFPTSHVAELRRFVRQTGVAILAGLSPRELGRAVPVTRTVARCGPRVFVNEAVLMLPNRLHKPNHRITRVHAFRIRKSYPSSIELGMTRYVADRSGMPSAWEPGFVWYRFSYPRWGSFSVGLCSDILDTEVWHHLRGRIQHLFLVAWNLDVELFDQMTWIRGYELYSNVVLANHGKIGGSLAWSPKDSHGKELLRLRGGGQSLAASVILPVKELVCRQMTQLKDSVKRNAREWGELVDGCSSECRPCQPRKCEKKGSSFKTPAPRFRYRG